MRSRRRAGGLNTLSQEISGDKFGICSETAELEKMWASMQTCGCERQRRRELERRCGRRRSVFPTILCCLLFLLLDCCLGTSPNSPDCRPPCENVVCPTVGICENGTYELCNGCCTGCAAGLGQVCHTFSALFPPCGDGLRCGGESRYRPGLCEALPTPPATNATTDAPSPSPSPPSPSPSPTNSTVATAEPPTEDCSGDNMSVSCRPSCSVDFCSERTTRKKRICSAAGLSPVLPERNRCQHTTCGACFLLREANCTDLTCPEPPTKDCLRSFYTCVRDFYFGPSISSNMIRLEDPLARSTAGRVVCLVPSLARHTHGSSSSSYRSSQEDVPDGSTWP